MAFIGGFIGMTLQFHGELWRVVRTADPSTPLRSAQDDTLQRRLYCEAGEKGGFAGEKAW
ncbi:MAG: hypothetical protein C5B56_00830 [Proteobacteria bacterium]|nr:MAG: hypothetical protein C5B56_00830 [Pseudomonadota bacterium]